MQEDNVSAISAESIAFIFRHPLIIISTIIIVFNTAHIYFTSKPLEYQCTAVLSFELVGDTTIERKSGDPKRDLIDARRDIISKVLLGDNIRHIIGEVRSGLDEKAEPAAYNKFVGKLRNPKGGIQLQQDDKNNVNLVTISFIDPDPKLCYKTVSSTVETITSENKKTSAEKVQKKITFLRNQVEFYKNRLEVIDKEMDGIKNILVENFPKLTDQEKDLISGIAGDNEAIKQQRLAVFTKYDETLALLNLDLLDMEKKKKNLQKELTSPTISIKRRSEEAGKADIFMGEYSKAMASKELEVAGLISSGYKEEHPQIKKIQSEINQLKELGKQRSRELSGTSQAFGMETAREKIAADIEDLDFQVESLKSKIDTIKEYRSGAIRQLKPNEIGRKDVAERVARLVDLEKEKAINEGYYLDIRKQLEEADLRGRIEKEEAGLRILTVEEPKMPISPIPFQRFKYLLMAIMLSIAAGLSVAYIVDSMDSSVRTGEELRKLIIVPVLATIDRITTEEELAAKRNQRKIIFIGLVGFVVLSRIFAFLILAMK